MKKALVLLAVLAVPAGSHAAPQGGTPTALVTAESENALLVVDLDSRKVVRGLPMPADPPTGGSPPVRSRRAGP